MPPRVRLVTLADRQAIAIVRHGVSTRELGQYPVNELQKVTDSASVKSRSASSPRIALILSNCLSMSTSLTSRHFCDVSDTMWDVLTNEGNLDAEQLEPIKTCYYKQMKPTVSQDQLVVLRAKYGVRHK